MTNDKLRNLKIALCGAFIGLANLVPGISGGTVAVVFDIYDEVIGSFRGILSRDKLWKKHLAFILPLLIGLLMALFLFASAIELLMESYPTHMRLFFVGLIIGSVPFIYKRLEPKNIRRAYMIPAVMCLFIPIILMLVQAQERAPISDPVLMDIPMIVSTGFISSATMLLPGISGNVVLMVIGMYSTLIAALSNLNWFVLLVLALGKILGLLIVSKVIHFLLERFYHITYLSIIGLILGSTVNIWPGFSGGIILSDLSVIGSGFFLAYLFQESR